MFKRVKRSVKNPYISSPIKHALTKLHSWIRAVSLHSKTAGTETRFELWQFKLGWSIISPIIQGNSTPLLVLQTQFLLFLSDGSCSAASEVCADMRCPGDMQCVGTDSSRGPYVCQCPPGKLGECAGNLWPLCEASLYIINNVAPSGNICGFFFSLCVLQDTPLWASLGTVISSTEWRMRKEAERWS